MLLADQPPLVFSLGPLFPPYSHLGSIEARAKDFDWPY